MCVVCCVLCLCVKQTDWCFGQANVRVCGAIRIKLVWIWLFFIIVLFFIMFIALWFLLHWIVLYCNVLQSSCVRVVVGYVFKVNVYVSHSKKPLTWFLWVLVSPQNSAGRQTLIWWTIRRGSSSQNNALWMPFVGLLSFFVCVCVLVDNVRKVNVFICHQENIRALAWILTKQCCWNGCGCETSVRHDTWLTLWDTIAFVYVLHVKVNVYRLFCKNIRVIG